MSTADEGGQQRPASPPQLAELVLPDTRVLAALRGRCFVLTRDYWTYEFCPMQRARQFHKEGARTTVEILLGQYDKGADKLTVGVQGLMSATSPPHVYSQTYVNGTSDRSVQVRVRCASKNEHSLLGVDEPSMHKYVLMFSTPLVCDLSCAHAYVPVIAGTKRVGGTRMQNVVYGKRRRPD